MSLRDLALFVLLTIIVVMVWKRPFVGALGWVLFGVMNPHRMAWGAAYDFPFAAVIAAVTLLALLISPASKKPKGGAAAAVLLMFLAWNCITTMFAFNPDPSWDYLSRVFKVFLMTFVLMMVMQTRRDVILLVATLALSLSFFGTKGGVFVMATGGNFMVNGPPDSPMEGNNSLGVGLTMVIPLLYFLLQQADNKWLRRALMASMVLCAISVLGSYSRGAMLGIMAMSALMWWRGRNKLTILAVVATLAVVAVPAMPDRWFSKMDTLEHYDKDESAMFRLYAWETAYNIAKDKFPVAGGFEWESPMASMKYSPLPTLVLVPHSIYFQVIGSQGFIGLALFLTFWVLVWCQCGWLRHHCRDRPDLAWGRTLGSMVQVSIAGYAVGGAFLDLAFWDLPYYLYAAVASAKYVANQALSQPLDDGSAALRSAAPSGMDRVARA